MGLHIHIALFGIAIFLTCGCASTTSTAKRDVSQGMTVAEVTNLLGTPDEMTVHYNRVIRPTFWTKC